MKLYFMPKNVQNKSRTADLMELVEENDSKFSEAITVLLSWIERGEVNRRSANQFYSMVQSANSHVRRLMNEKATHEQEMEEAKENFKNALTGILTQCK
ncbi:Ecto-NOX disulfide-thiol exchanger 1 [Saguinus oedipus]|uniref:Ecto-NOX disulfide-thiol exchanger 1 n=1 Tax=Saguinus oedipus TaxID=9490 RepID=A0ABQ9VVA8_SAGOE|nr:Ecto-NOX disulfide-thiol exchanger 1 [Saguinus oedipus]